MLKLVEFHYLVALLDFDHLKGMELLFVIRAHHIWDLVRKPLLQLTWSKVLLNHGLVLRRFLAHDECGFIQACHEHIGVAGFEPLILSVVLGDLHLVHFLAGEDIPSY